MKTSIKVVTLVTALALAGPVAAKSVSISGNMNSYYGNRAFIVGYIAAPDGSYATTIYAAGRNGSYFRHLSRWYRMFVRARKTFDGTTGASVGSNGSFSTNLNIPDSMINAGYTFNMETAVEHGHYYPNDVSIPLDSAHNGKTVGGSGFIKAVTLNF